MLAFLLFLSVTLFCLQCFDAVGLALRRAVGLLKLSDEVLALLSAWSEMPIICYFITIQTGLTRLTFLVPANLGCPGKAVKWVCLSVTLLNGVVSEDGSCAPAFNFVSARLRGAINEC